MNFFQVIGQFPLPTYLATGYENVDTLDKGVVGLISNVVKTVIVIGGVWAFINLIIAGFHYVIYGGDKPEEIIKAHQKIYMSIIGLIIMVGSFVIAGIVSWMIYGDPTFILNPRVYGPN